LPSDAAGCQTTLRLAGDHTITALFTPTTAPKQGHVAVNRSFDAHFH
jgi:hypothetical protein